MTKLLSAFAVAALLCCGPAAADGCMPMTYAQAADVLAGIADRIERGAAQADDVETLRRLSRCMKDRAVSAK